MAVEIAGACLHWLQPPLPCGSLPPKTLARAISSLHATSRNFHDRVFSQHTCRRSNFLGAARFHRPHQRRRARGGRFKVSSTISLDGFFGDGEDDEEEEFVKRFNELALQFNIEADSRDIQDPPSSSSSSSEELPSIAPASEPIPTLPNSINLDITRMLAEPWPGSDRFTPEKVEHRANSIDLPLSLRILKRKKKGWESAELTESDCSSVNKAFSFMVFIVRELQSHMICLREALFSPENFQIKGILARVHEELHASFVWLFYRVFSATPNLMVCLMLLLANFTVFSITEHQAMAAPQPPIQSVSTALEESQKPNQRFHSSDVKTFSVGRSNAVGGSGSGGGKAPFLAGAADEDHSYRFSPSFGHASSISPEAMPTVSIRKEEANIWKRIVEEARMMQASERHEALMDPETLRRFVSPVTAVAERDDISAYYATELSYLRAIADDPDDPLLLSNFALFLFTVFRDYDRAEEYFKRAARAEPADAEALSRYANFLWVARSDLSAAEETFLEAIAADPGNSYYTANYAHFLWSTGGEDTCYPLPGCDS